jgi:hypothetical protein
VNYRKYFQCSKPIRELEPSGQLVTETPVKPNDIK